MPRSRHSGCALLLMLMFFILCFPFICTESLACSEDIYDSGREIEAIRKGLQEVKLTAVDRSEINKLLEFASFRSPAILGRGILNQSRARGQALEKLGLERIPQKPRREFDAIQAELARRSDAQKDREAMKFTFTDETAVQAAKDARDAANRAKDAECKKRGDKCRALEADAKIAGEKFEKAASNKAETDAAKNERQIEAAQLRDEAEMLWSERRYADAHRALNKALALLGIEVRHIRC